MNKLMMVPALALLMTGCGSLLSESPLYTTESVVLDPALIGAWQSMKGDDILVVRKSTDNGYEVLYSSMEDSSHTMKFDVHMVQLKGTRFLDIVRDSPGWSIPAHTFAKVSLSGTLTISFFDSDWLKKRIETATRFKDGELIVIHDGTPALQQMLTTYANEPQAFTDEAEFRRIEK